MKSLFLVIGLMFLLTACPREQEVRNMMESLKQDKASAVAVIERRSFILDDMLTVQDYFFHFGERVHLLKEDPESLANIKKYIKKSGVTNFCNDFVIARNDWKKLQIYCEGGEYNRCSADINTYASSFQQMLKSLGPELATEINNTPSCN